MTNGDIGLGYNHPTAVWQRSSEQNPRGFPEKGYRNLCSSVGSIFGKTHMQSHKSGVRSRPKRPAGFSSAFRIIFLRVSSRLPTHLIEFPIDWYGCTN